MIFLEYKYKNNDVPLGQKIALTRNADNNQKAGKKAVVMICEHNVEDYRQDVKASDAIVREFYYAGEWYKDGKSTVKQKIDSFINFVNKQPF